MSDIFVRIYIQIEAERNSEVWKFEKGWLAQVKKQNLAEYI